MQNLLAINPQVASLEQEIRFTQYRLQITGDVSVRRSALARLRDLRCQIEPGGFLPRPCYRCPPQAAQLGLHAVICTGFTARCFALHCGWKRLLSICETSRSEGRWLTFSDFRF